MYREDLAQEIGELAYQLRLHGELDASFGLAASPAPAELEALPSRRFEREPSVDGGGASAPGEERRTALASASPRPAEPVAAPRPSEAERPSTKKRLSESPEALEGRRTKNREALRALYRELDGCTRCRLHESRTRLVFGQGDAAAELVFVGEGPGYNEDKEGLAFVGASGELLTKMIDAMGLDREEAFICNVVKCRPPKNRNPQPDEMKTCLPFLEQQLSIIQPRVIVALGKTAGQGLGLLSPNESLGRNRGFHRWNGIPTMLTYHPAYLLRSPRDKRLTWQDLQQVLPYLTRRRETGGA